MTDFNPWSDNSDDELANAYEEEAELHLHKIMLVDCRPCMFEHNPHDEEAAGLGTYFESVMDIVLETYKDTIIRSPKDKLSLVLFGTRDKHDTEFEHVWVVEALQHPEAETIKKITEMRGYTAADFERRIGSLKRRYPTSIACLAFSPSGEQLAVAASYTYENGEQKAPPDAIYLQKVSDSPATFKPKAEKAK